MKETQEESDGQKLPDLIAKTVPPYVAQLILAAACLLAAIVHAFAPDRIDTTTAALLALAGVVLFFDKLTKFKGFGFEFEKEVREKLETMKTDMNLVKHDVNAVQENMDDLGKNVGPGSRSPVGLPSSVNILEVAQPEAFDPGDPNKNQFGGSEAANHRILEAKIIPLRGPNSPLCRINVRVRSTSPDNHPLASSVTFHLHPTFGGGAIQTIPVKDGVAEIKTVAYGAFTIGAEADNGTTRLELDLVRVPGGTDRFREN